MSAPLLYGPDGNTPVAFDGPDPNAVEPTGEPISQRTTELLMLAFGAIVGVMPGRRVANNQEWQAYRNHATLCIIEELGPDMVKQWFGIEFEMPERPKGEAEES